MSAPIRANSGATPAGRGRLSKTARSEMMGRRMGETVRLKASDGFQLSAYVAQPAGTPKGGLVVVQEIFGVNGHIKRVADGFAADGFLAIAPELFERIHPGIVLGYGENEIKVGIDMKGKSPTDKALADIAAARDYVKNAGKVAVI